MKIIVASTIVPFVEGGGTLIVDWLEEKLREAGHQVDVLKIPFSSYYKEMLPQLLALRLYHLEEACDRLICIRMPSYLLQHPDKYLWFIHHYREVYDLWETPLDFLPKDPETKAIREYVMRADDMAFKEAKKIYTNSKIVSKRLMDFNRVPSTPLYPPIYDPSRFYCEGYGDFIYYSSRICQAKRQLLAVQAMKYTRSGVRLLLTGKAEQQGYLEEITGFIKRHSLEKKVVLREEWISEEEKADYNARCLAAVYIPVDEDSYGYPSLEAHHSGKAVISCTDSGGTDELILPGQNGFLVDPDPKKLAEVFDKLYEDKALAERMGGRGEARIEELGITWENVIRRFTE
ncbi:MAG: glycosyltransferase [Provencibacterium sp.]|jgi:glycosyltransferase involved in cell wall biosynthesis|nr:glycosyltransferase [Provencibacterium sp.]